MADSIMADLIMAAVLTMADSTMAVGDANALLCEFLVVTRGTVKQETIQVTKSRTKICPY